MSKSVAARPENAFHPNCYALTSRGVLMPAVMVEALPDAYGASVTVRAPNGVEYSFSGERVFSVEEAEEALRRDRVERVVTGYRFETLSDHHGRREVRCTNPEHPVRSSYILTITKSRQSCTCPAFLRGAGSVPCKHLAAYGILQEREPATEPAPKPAARAYSAAEW